MERNKRQFILRPGITNPQLWYPDRPPEPEWQRIRKLVLERDNWTCLFCGHRALKWMNLHHLEDSFDNTPENLAPVCVACHAVLHMGLSLKNGVLEIWECDTSQVEIVRSTRESIKRGLSLAEFKSRLSLKRGMYPPDSTQYANDLICKMGKAPRAYLDEPLCAVFVNLTRWQIDDR